MTWTERPRRLILRRFSPYQLEVPDRQPPIRCLMDWQGWQIMGGSCLMGQFARLTQEITRRKQVCCSPGFDDGQIVGIRSPRKAVNLCVIALAGDQRLADKLAADARRGAGQHVAAGVIKGQVEMAAGHREADGYVQVPRLPRNKGKVICVGGSVDGQTGLTHGIDLAEGCRRTQAVVDFESVGTERGWRNVVIQVGG